MYLENLLTLLEVGQFDMYLPVKTSGTEQGGVEYVGTVGSGEDDNAGVGTEAVHLGEELVERALAFIVTAGHDTFAAAAPDGVYLIDEDDRRCFLFGLPEEVAHAACADADEHLHEIATGHREEGHIRLAGYGFREERLTGSRRSYEECAFRYFSTYLRVFFRIFQELDYLLHFLLGAIESGYIPEGHFVLFLLVKELCFGSSDAEDTSGSVSAADAAAHIDEEEDEQCERQDIDEDEIPVVV